MATTPQPTASQVREELDRLLDDATFRRAPSHSRLLRYLVERKAAGDDGALCEAGIAMAVFQRDPAVYDAELDPIVRVSIGRLRGRLDKHYQHFEHAPETIITLPKGRYAPEFHHRPSGAKAKVACGLAVMPTRNLTGDPGFDALAQGLSDRLSEALVLTGLPRVIALASVQQAQNTMQSPVEIARQLGVNEIIETALSPETNQRTRISARLIRAADAELMWAEVRTTANHNPYAGIDALFDAVLARFAAAPNFASLASNGSTKPSKPQLPTVARSKIESARMLISHMSVTSIDQAKALLTEVTQEFPEVADAWALRGRTCVRRINYGDLPAPPLFAELQECVRAAITINPNHIEGLALRALILHWTGVLPQAEIEFRDVLRAAPNHTSARLGFAWLLVAQGRFDGALIEIDAASSFAPMSLNILFNRAFILSLARRHDAARSVFETGMRVGGETLFSLSACAGNELWAGNLNEAAALYLRIGELYPANAISHYGQAHVAALRGERANALALAQAARERWTVPCHFREAELLAWLGDGVGALAELEQAIKAMESPSILAAVTCAFECLAEDLGFLTLLARLGLRRRYGDRGSKP